MASSRLVADRAAAAMTPTREALLEPRTTLIERLYTIFASDVVLEAEVEELVRAIEAESAAPLRAVLERLLRMLDLGYDPKGPDLAYVREEARALAANPPAATEEEGE